MARRRTIEDRHETVANGFGLPPRQAAGIPSQADPQQRRSYEDQQYSGGP